jgi:hypothetical protein
LVQKDFADYYKSPATLRGKRIPKSSAPPAKAWMNRFEALGVIKKNPVFYQAKFEFFSDTVAELTGRGDGREATLSTYSMP